MTARTDRIDQLLREEIGQILARDVQDPRIGFVTITDVDTAPDLSTARVWVSVIGQPTERDLTLRALQRAMPFVRRELGRKIHLRRIPELQIRADDTAQRGTRVLQILAELEAGATPADEPVVEESLPTPAPRFAEQVQEQEQEQRSEGPGRRPRKGAAAADRKGRPSTRPRRGGRP
jgi:ribosome-binding factor A